MRACSGGAHGCLGRRILVSWLPAHDDAALLRFNVLGMGPFVGRFRTGAFLSAACGYGAGSSIGSAPRLATGPYREPVPLHNGTFFDRCRRVRLAGAEAAKSSAGRESSMMGDSFSRGITMDVHSREQFHNVAGGLTPGFASKRLILRVVTSAARMLGVLLCLLLPSHAGAQFGASMSEEAGAPASQVVAIRAGRLFDS